MEKKINIIFAVKEEAYETYVTYERLCQRIEGCVVGRLQKGFGNVVELVKDNYEVY
jgi:hypothetical protein